MKKYVVPHGIASLLKTKGFKESCLFMYDKLHMFSSNISDGREFEGMNYNTSGYCCSAPFWDQVIEWFRENSNEF